MSWPAGLQACRPAGLQALGVGGALENEGLELEDILSELETRFGTSGHEEKSSR